MTLVECVPNFSDGRDASIAAAIQQGIRSVPGVRLLDWHSDPDHHRSVATFSGQGEPVAEAAFRAVVAAAERIDLSAHRGVHPRMGATDVCPFVPLERDGLGACVELAHGLGRRVAGELAIPVYFYGAAALRPERRALPEVRRGGFETLREAVARDPRRTPDSIRRRARSPSARAGSSSRST
jgi:glutamate formiminotransferase